jgi:DNA-directed RNA polymerase specialized sigma24 family protein
VPPCCPPPPHRTRLEHPTDAIPEVASPEDPAGQVILTEELRAQLEGLDARTAVVLRLATEGYSHREIAEHFSVQLGQPMTAKAVESILGRHRHRQRKGA